MKTAIEQFRQDFGGSSIAFTWVGTERSERGHALDEAAEYLGAEKRQMRLVRVLFDTGDERYRRLTRIRSRVRDYWETYTLPYVENRVRLVRISMIPELRQAFGQYRSELREASEDFVGAWPDVVARARELLGDRLWREGDYALPDGADSFSFHFSWPSLEPPEYLALVDQEEYRRQEELLKARFAAAHDMAEQLVVRQLRELFEGLRERLRPGDDGKPKVMRAGTLDKFQEFFARFRAFSFRPGSDIDGLIAQAEHLMGGVTVKDLKGDETLRSLVAAEAEDISERLAGLVTTPGARKLQLGPPPSPAAAPAIPAAEETGEEQPPLPFGGDAVGAAMAG